MIQNLLVRDGTGTCSRSTSREHATQNRKKVKPVRDHVKKRE